MKIQTTRCMNLVLQLLLVVSCCNAENICCIGDCFGLQPPCPAFALGPVFKFEIFSIAGRFCVPRIIWGVDQIIPEDNGTVVTCTSAGERSLICESMLETDPTALKYYGTDGFCSINPCVPINSYYNCYCSLNVVYMNELAACDIDAVATQVDSRTNVTYMYYSNTPLNQNAARSLLNIPIDAVEAEDVYVNFENQIVSFVFSNLVEHAIYLQKEDWFFVKVVNASNFQYRIPDSAALTSGSLQVRVSHGIAVVYQNTFDVVGVQICRFHDCLMCWDAYTNWSCIPSTYKWMIVATLLLLLTSFACLLPSAIRGIANITYYLIIMPLWTAGMCCFWIYKGKLMQDIREGTKNKTTKIKNYVFAGPELPIVMERDTAEGKQEESNENLYAFKPKRKSRKSKAILESSSDSDSITAETAQKEVATAPRKVGLRGNKSFVYFNSVLCCMAIFFDSTMAGCSSGVFIPTSFQQCSKVSATVETCNVMFQLTATLQYPGDSLCFTVQTNDTSQSIMNGVITYDQMIDTIDLSTTYYTGDFTVKGQTYDKCYNVIAAFGASTDCPNKCNDINNQVCGRNACGWLTDPNVINYPGMTRCDRVSSGWTIQCAVGSTYPSCLFSGYGIKPGNVARVSSMVSRSHQPTIDVLLQVNGQNLTGNATMSGSCTTTGIFKTCVIGSLVGDTTEFGGLSVVTSSGNTYLSNVSPASSPIAGTVGEIQGTSMSSITAATYNSFIFDPTIVTATVGNDAVLYTTQTPGLTRMVNSATKLPAMVGGNLWDLGANGKLSATINNPGALLITVETTQQITVTRQIDVVCPVVALTTASGCYSCSIGSVVRVTARSTCMSGNVQVTTDSDFVTVKNNFISLSGSNTTYDIHIMTIIPDNNFIMTFTGSGGIVQIPIVFKAVEMVNISSVDTIPVDSTMSTASVPGQSPDLLSLIGDWFDNIFKGASSWYNYLILVAIIAGCILIIVFLGPPLVRSAFSLFGTLKSRFAKKDKSG